MPFWQAQPGPQALASVSPFDLTFFGGTRGGGKSDAVVGRNVAGAEKYGKHWNALIIRRKYREFAELRRRWDEMINAGLPATRIGGDQQTNFIRFKNGATVTMAAVNRRELIGAFQGHQYCEIDIDEAPQIPFIAGMIEELKACLRSPAGVPCRMFLTGNPGGAGASVIKEMFVSLGHCKPHRDEAGFSYVFIRSTLFDNKILCTKDPGYVLRLLSIKDEQIRKAWLYGDWDAFVGQAFVFGSRHIIKGVPVPAHAPIYMSFDWGFGAPFSVGWWWVDADGRIYRFAEWYGTDPKIPGAGLRLTDSRIAQGIRDREEKLGIANRSIVRLAGHDCFAAKPDYKGGGQGPSTAEEFAAFGIFLTMGDSTRHLKIRQFRNRLQIPESPLELPMLVVYDTCKHFIRTIPSLVVDEDNPEDVDTDQEDHCLHGDTLIPTDKGIKPIRDIVGTIGFIKSLDGYQPYHSCRLTRKDAQLIKVIFSDGSSVRCTKDHEFLLSNGTWKSAGDLTDETCYVSIQPIDVGEKTCALPSSATRFKSSTASDTTYADNISEETESCYTVLSGNTTMGRYRSISIFITRHMTGIRTKLKTWISNLTEHIGLIIPNRMTIHPGQQACMLVQQNGMAARPALNGISNNTNNTASRRFQQQSINVANIARPNSTASNIQSFAVENVQTRRGSRTGSGQKTEDVQYVSRYSRLYGQAKSNIVLSHVQPNNDGNGIKVVSVQPSGSDDVYCLTVDSLHCFALSNNVIVSNCYDESCHVCMARPMGGQALESFAPSLIDRAAV